MIRVHSFPGRGNALVACQDITKDSLIFSDKPMLQSYTENSPIVCTICRQAIKVQSSESFPCSGECGFVFCSNECRIEMEKSGHRWVCSGYKPDGVIKNLSSNDPQGHIRLAYILYGTLLEGLCENPSSTPIEVFSDFLGTVQTEDYCETVHAFRNGLAEVDDTIFSALIAPAYFSAYLAEPLAAIRNYFGAGNIQDMFVAEGGSIERFNEFLESELFSQKFLQDVIGSFVINNLELRCPLTDCNGNGLAVGTGLYRKYSKMNHSCVCNTRNLVVGPHQAEVSVYAARDIKEGEEITTTYLHMDHPESISRKARNVLLRQYLFSCNCGLCSQAGGQPEDSDSDGDY